MSENRQPKGIPAGGQFAATAHSEPHVDLEAGLNVDKDAANYFADQVESIREARLQGSLTATPDRLTYTAPDGIAFDIHQDGHTNEDGEPGWSIDNHEHASVDHPAYGLRYETTTEALGESLQEAVFDAACAEAFTLGEGSETKDFRQFYTVWPEREPAAVADFLDIETADDISVHYDIERRLLHVYRNGQNVDREEADAILEDLVGTTELDVPGGSPSQQMAWHMERSFRMAAAKPDSPEWTHSYRVAGLDWEDRFDGR